MQEFNNPDQELETSTALDTVQENQKNNGPKTWVFIVIGVIILGLIITGAVFLLTSEPTVTGKIRDVFIIIMALESLVIGVALIILIIQLAILTNLIQNEIRPILDTTNETVNTLRGTATFLSDNLSEPVIVLNEYLATLKKIFSLIRSKK